MGGAWLALHSPENHPIQAGLHYEAVLSKADGKLDDGNRHADYVADHLGYAITPSIAWRNLKLSYRLEELSLENKLKGDGAFLVARAANLLNERNPKRQTVQLNWQVNKKIGVRVAYTQDDTLPKGNDRVSVGLVWQDTFAK